MGAMLGGGRVPGGYMPKRTHLKTAAEAALFSRSQPRANALPVDTYPDEMPQDGLPQIDGSSETSTETRDIKGFRTPFAQFLSSLSSPEQQLLSLLLLPRRMDLSPLSSWTSLSSLSSSPA